MLEVAGSAARSAVDVAGAGVRTVATVAEAGVRAVVPDRSDYSNKWRLECSGNAESDGEDVLVKRKGRAPDLALQVAGNTVEGLRLNPDKE